MLSLYTYKVLSSFASSGSQMRGVQRVQDLNWHPVPLPKPKHTCSALSKDSLCAVVFSGEILTLFLYGEYIEHRSPNHHCSTHKTQSNLLKIQIQWDCKTLATLFFTLKSFDLFKNNSVPYNPQCLIFMHYFWLYLLMSNQSLEVHCSVKMFGWVLFKNSNVADM